ncbi:ThuA domain-containing protein [Parerythrobacter jejuensis]|uniref:ThuA domain-containing protein n=1 Tax=Parerythrobacter jejuensis TaxID=795812 RepID=A0A845AV70_9SPHN|nr:ThuA domain-containing protein [Parerythrobacter jejuensis]MXP30225.1 ThuA domain-containing protein [Parerythrobacter jejuensis]MXP32985.1 ThuA domain-containing protein [Parerythrobacter jejuensis]
MATLLVLSGGHPYEEEPFDELIHALGDWDVTHLVHPEAEQAVAAGAADSADALLFYDMGGYEFADGKVSARAPSKAYREAIMRRFASGKGAVAMHHALAGWAEWPEWHQMLGGRFLYQPGEFRGQKVPDSGYRHDVVYEAEVVLDHPVTRGVPAQFDLVDELYLAQVNESDITPLIRARHDFAAENFYSAASAVAGQMFSNDGWDHPPGSNCVGWVRQVQDAPLVYLQFGDGPATYRDPSVRKLLSNALAFTGGNP